MKLTYLALGLMGAGAVVVVLSFLWPSLVGGKRVWTDAQAEEHVKATLKAHALSHTLGHVHDHGSRAEQEKLAADFEEAKQHRERTAADLEQAQTRGEGMALLLKWTGAICVFAGGIGFFALRSARE